MDIDFFLQTPHLLKIASIEELPLDTNSWPFCNDGRLPGIVVTVRLR